MFLINSCLLSSLDLVTIEKFLLKKVYEWTNEIY